MKYRSFQEALNYAIGREQDAEGFYHLLAKCARQPATREMLEELAVQEHQHQERLQALEPGDVAGKRVRQTEVDEAADRKAVAFDPEMDFVAALRLAIQREEDSVRLYQMLGQEAEDEAQQKLFRLLVGQEQGHRTRLQDELDSVVLRDY